MVWTLRATSCSAELGCLLLYSIFILIILRVMNVFGNIQLHSWMWSCSFFYLNPILYCSLCYALSPWINTWSGDYFCLLINIFCSFLLWVLLRFYFILFLFHPFSYMLPKSFSLPLGVHWGMTEVLIRDEACNNLTQILDSWFRGSSSELQKSGICIIEIRIYLTLPTSGNRGEILGVWFSILLEKWSSRYNWWFPWKQPCCHSLLIYFIKKN